MSVTTPFLNTLLANPRVASLRERTQNPETQRRLVLIIVCIALLLDNMLYMVIVPIIPVFLEKPQPKHFQYHEKMYVYKDKDWLNAEEVQRRNLTGSPDLKPLPPKVVDKINDEINEMLKFTAAMRSTEDKSIGWLFASKAIVQLFVSPFAGPIIDRLGYERPLIVGLAVLFVSTSRDHSSSDWPSCSSRRRSSLSVAATWYCSSLEVCRASVRRLPTPPD